MYQDLIYGLRSWLHKPLFTLIALLTLGLGIGANTYIFSVVDSVLLHPFPYRDVDRLVALGATFPQFSPAEERFVAPGFIDVHTHVESRSGRGGLEATPRGDNFLLDGVTTIITGNCGSSEIQVGAWFSKLEELGLGLNVATFVGHTPSRRASPGADGKRRGRGQWVSTVVDTFR